MKYLKSIKELFDSEELKSKNEIEYLTGDILNNYKSIDIKNDSISRLLYKIFRYNVPFIEAFVDKVEKGNELETIDINIVIPSGDLSDYFVLRSSQDEKSVALGIKINGVGNYDVFLLWETKDDDTEAIEYKGLDYTELIDVIKSEYTEKLQKLGFSELLNYGQVSDLK